MYAPGTDHAVIRVPRARARWRRWVGRAVVVVAALGLLFFGLAHSVQGGAPLAYETVTVEPGDTLWAIVADRYPTSDLRDRVIQIERANGMHGPAISPGEHLRVPST